MDGLQALGGSLAFLSFIAESVGGWFADVWTSLTSRGGIDEMQRMDSALASVELVMLAILADGTVSDSETLALQYFIDARGLNETAGRALEDFARRITDGSSDPEKLSALTRASSARVAPERRMDVLTAIAQIAMRMQTVEHSRELAHAHGAPATLVRRMGAAMGMSESDCERALSTPSV